jgi:hypothetical protein
LRGRGRCRRRGRKERPPVSAVGTRLACGFASAISRPAGSRASAVTSRPMIVGAS